MEAIKQDKARFDARLSLDQKQFFERAAILGGFRNLTDFVIATVQNRANEIVKQREQIIASQRDNELFFDSLVNPPKANNDLLSAANEYKALVSK